MPPAHREAILRGAIDLLAERGLLAWLSDLRLRSAARRAGVSAGAAYRIWPTQHQFHRDVVKAVVTDRDGSAVSETVEAIRALVENDRDFDDVIVAGALANLHHRPRDDHYFDVLALRLVAASDAELQRDARERFHAGLDDYELLYAAMLRLTGRQVRPPLTVHELALVFAALGEGFAMQSSIGIDHPICTSADDRTAAVPLLAHLVRCITDVLTEPVNRNDPEAPT